MNDLITVTDHRNCIAEAGAPADSSSLHRRLPPQLCGTLIGPRAHICAFFRSSEERDRTLLPFMLEGLAAGEKIVNTVDPGHCARTVSRLAAAGVEVDAVSRQGQFDLHPWTDTHLIAGKFDSARTLAFFEGLKQRATQAGFPFRRFVTHMEWALEGGVLLSDLLAYEAKANQIWLEPTGPVDPVVCAYDLTKLSGQLVVDIMHTHPMTLIDGVLFENPFFVPPEEFLDEHRNERLFGPGRSHVLVTDK